MRDDPFKEFVLDQLRGLEGLGCRAMFGGYGLYVGDVFFGIIHDGQMYLKTTDGTRGEFLRRGMGPFRPSEKQTLKTYYQVPPEILEDRDALLEWSRHAASHPLKTAGRRRRDA